MNIDIEDTIIPSVYTDSEGNERTLRQMFNYEPEWFYSRFEHMQKALEQQQKEIEQLKNGNEWISVDDRLPIYIRQKNGEPYHSLKQTNSNRYLVQIERNSENYVEGGIYLDVLSFSNIREFYGYDMTGKGTDNWRERVVKWKPLPKPPED